MPRSVRHGAQWAYRTGCRCALCREWKRRDVAEYRRRNPTKARADQRARRARRRGALTPGLKGDVSGAPQP